MNEKAIRASRVKRLLLSYLNPDIYRVSSPPLLHTQPAFSTNERYGIFTINMCV
jgi:hypothetical protein